MKLYQFTNKETGLVELITGDPKVIEKHFNLSLDELNKMLKETGLINGKYEISVMFID